MAEPACRSCGNQVSTELAEFIDSCPNPPGPYGVLVLSRDDLKLMKRLLRHALNKVEFDPEVLRRGAGMILFIDSAVRSAKPVV